MITDEILVVFLHGENNISTYENKNRRTKSY